MYVIVHEEMTSIMICRTTFCGACQCHRILMPSSCSVTPFSWYILNIHAYTMYLVTMRKRSTPVYLLNIMGSASHKETEHFDMSRPWLFCLLYILVHINVCQCLWNQYFIVILFLSCAVGQAFIWSQQYAQSLLHPCSCNWIL